jgi:RNA polymerase sigma-70 factor (ECF subfamily)
MSYAGQTPNIPRAKKMDLSVIAGNNPARPRVFMPMEAPAPDVPPTFDHLMLPHLDAAYNLARWLLRNDQDAEDAVQESCLRAWRAFNRFRGGDARAWLLTIVRNVCYTHLRQVRREPALEEFNE